MMNLAYGGTAFPVASDISELTIRGGVEIPADGSGDGIVDDPSWYVTD